MFTEQAVGLFGGEESDPVIGAGGIEGENRAILRACAAVAEIAAEIGRAHV